MAKMFYSLEETAARLRKTPEEVKQMSSRGQLAEFRDGDRLLFKVDQVDVLAGDDDPDSAASSMIPLADTGANTALGIGLADSSMGSAMMSSAASMAASRIGLDPTTSAEGPKEKSGIPVFDADELELADPSAVTQVTETAIQGGAMEGGLSVESLGSGSGLMDLTRESDDTSLGAQGLLDELYPSDEGAAGATAVAASSGLFEGQAGGDLLPAEAPVAIAAPMEVYDGAGSGLTGGMTLGAVAALGTAIAVLIMSQFGVMPPFFTSIGGENAPLVWTGIFAGASVLLGGIGFMLLGRKSSA